MTGLNVVLIDDEKALRDVISEGLTALFDCSVRAEPDGESGLARLRDEGADVLLLDLLMPGLDGFKVLERLNDEHAEHRPGRVIVMSALTDRSTMRSLAELRVDTVLPKPFSLAELRIALRINEQVGTGDIAAARAV